MQNSLQERGIGLRAVFVALAVALAMTFACALVAPATAFALDTESARSPERRIRNDILGGTETRITWEGRAAADEQVTGITHASRGHRVSTDNARVTVLTGADLMTRNPVTASFSADGDAFKAVFAEPAQAGGYIRVEIYGVKFPASGGDMQITGTYTLADGEVREITDVPAIIVESIDPFKQFSQYLRRAALGSVVELQQVPQAVSGPHHFGDELAGGVLGLF